LQIVIPRKRTIEETWQGANSMDKNIQKMIEAAKESIQAADRTRLLHAVLPPQKARRKCA
jgi:ribosomal protein L17